MKQLVVTRICQPRSKVATVDYLKSYYDEDVELNKIYRYLDKLYDRHNAKPDFTDRKILTIYLFTGHCLDSGARDG